MKKRPYRKEFYSGITMTVLLLGIILWIGSLKKQQDVDILFLGDSIIGRNRTETSIPSIVGQTLGKTVYNGAFGGSSLSAGDKKQASYTENSISMAILADALYSGDFSAQESDLVSSRDRVVQNEDFVAVLKGLKKVKTDHVSTIILEHGVNDYNGQRPLDNEQDPYDIHTFGGALRYSLETLSLACPNAQIVLLSPIYCYFSWEDEDCMSRDYGYGTMEAYVDLEREIASAYDVRFIDLLHGLPINAETVHLYTSDGMHLTDEGCKLYGDYLAQQLKEELQ